MDKRMTAPQDKWAEIMKKAASSTAAATASATEAALRDALEAMQSSGAFTDAAEVEKIVNEVLEGQLKKFKEELLVPKAVEVTVPKMPKVKVDTAHYNFDKLVKMSGAKLNVALIGEAGTGKTFAAQQVADVLKVPHWTMSFHAKMTATDIRGYCDANGKYNESAIYKAFKNGGVLILDEFDRSNTEVTVSLNNLLAGDTYLFPNGETVTKHDTFRIIACQNTTGHGGSKAYASASRQDGATLNRFVRLDWDTDEALEVKIAGNTVATRAVQQMRKNARALSMTEVIISPRQSIDSNKLVALGFSVSDALHHTITMGMAEDVKKRLMKDVKLS